MIRITDLRLPLDHPPEALDAAIAARLGIDAGMLRDRVIARRGYDARKRSAILLTYSVDVATDDDAALLTRLHGVANVSATPDTTYRFVLPRVAPGATRLPPDASRPVIVGAGPCGFLAALVLAQMGLAPIVLERGKAVRERTQDTWGFWRNAQLQPESNVQFGEGGAGTFSDGKLWTQIRDPKHYGGKVLAEFVAAGAPEEILYVSKPHIGTFRLVKMVECMRASIEALGGEFRFESRVVDFLTEPHPSPTAQGAARRIRGVALAGGEVIRSDHVVLAIGHSARDTFALLDSCGVRLEAKPFSLGLRIEHPQSLIDRVRFGANAGHPLLGAADYKLVHHCTNGRSVYSFCMCPGGQVVAAASEAGGVVINGMSQYSRAERNANAALVVGVTPEDFPGGPLAGIDFQRQWERRAFELGGRDYAAPVQRVGDFLAGRASSALGAVIPSYQPAVRPCDLSECLPDYAVAALREALPAFERTIPGFCMPDAVLTGVETRTSSPVRIPRDAQFQSVSTVGLYPAGEGAGQAGGIMSAAIDGIRVAEAIALSLAGRSAAPAQTRN